MVIQYMAAPVRKPSYSGVRYC